MPRAASQSPSKPGRPR